MDELEVVETLAYLENIKVLSPEEEQAVSLSDEATAQFKAFLESSPIKKLSDNREKNIGAAMLMFLKMSKLHGEGVESKKALNQAVECILVVAEHQKISLVTGET